MEGILPIFFLLVVLKIPVLGAIWLVWWASKPVTEPEASEDEGGNFKRWDAEPRRPRGPRRGPHGGGAKALPDCPGREDEDRRPAGPAPGSPARGSSHPVRERARDRPLRAEGGSRRRGARGRGGLAAPPAARFRRGRAPLPLEVRM